MTDMQTRLEYLRGEIAAERISYGEIAELQSLAEHIDPSDVELLQWAGIEEVTSTDTAHVCADGKWVNDADVPIESTEHSERRCARCGERILVDPSERARLYAEHSAGSEAHEGDNRVEGCPTCYE